MAFRRPRQGVMGLANLRLLTEISDRRKSENRAIYALGRNVGFSYLLQTEGKVSGVDAVTGAVGVNRTAFYSVDSQRETNWLVRNAIHQKLEAFIDRAVLAYLYAFDHQNPAGYFDNGAGVSALVAIESNTFFLSSFFTSYFTIANEPDLADTKAAFDSYDEQVAAVMAWLETNKSTVLSTGSDTPNRLLFAAMAFYLGGRFLNSATYTNTGVDFINHALALLHPGGYFLEKGGWDSSYQGVCVLNMCSIWLNTTDAAFRATLKPTILTCANWLASRILPTGEVSAVGNTRTGLGQESQSGKIKEINYGEVSLALFYSSFILGRRDLAELGYRVQYYVYANS